MCPNEMLANSPYNSAQKNLATFSTDLRTSRFHGPSPSKILNSDAKLQAMSVDIQLLLINEQLLLVTIEIVLA